MLVLPVPDPRDARCPLPPSTDRSELLFLGSGSGLIPFVEKGGIDPHRPPFRMEDLQRLAEIYEELQFDGELGGLTPRAILTDTIKRPDGASRWAEFTPFYMTARNQAITLPYGEAAVGLSAAVDELTRLLSDPAHREAHWEHLRAWDDAEREHMAKARGPGDLPKELLDSMRAREGALNAIHDPAYVAEALRRLRAVGEGLHTRGGGHYPIVYVVNVPVESRRPPAWSTGEAGSFRLREPLPLDDVLYRIDLPAEAQATPGTDPELLSALGVKE